MLDNKKINILKTIEKYKSISKASERLYTAQPNLSRSLKQIEDELGFKVFERSKSPLYLTKEGKILFEYIEKFEELEIEMKEKINKSNNLKNCYIRIGALTFMSQYIIPNIVPKLMDLYPNLELSLTKYDSTSFEDALIKNEIDLFITNRNIDNSKLNSIHSLNDKIYLMIPKAIYCKGKDKLEDYSNETFFLLKPQKNLRKSVEDIFKVTNFYPQKVKLTSSIMDSVSFVRANKGVTFIYGSSIRMINSTSYCNFIEINGNYATINVIYKDLSFKPIAENLSNIIKNYISKLYITLR
ncbi:LysR family transcriptional regulator [Peptoniphilus sp.]|uniref:LysR family transcriptional regulator n=1 Tax=Peptoniphilus sp. TaxID=1971214 RepID=UPI002A82B5A9|nr:LysR family transcriptional regulator [Peptoniphilus sp.]MDY3903275.1 LysR family transcriptional regulator [Peptoniphilus sp.]